jgi:hypothetical protein
MLAEADEPARPPADALSPWPGHVEGSMDQLPASPFYKEEKTKTSPIPLILIGIAGILMVIAALFLILGR